MDDLATIQQRSFGSAFEADRRSRELLSMAYRVLQAASAAQVDSETGVQSVEEVAVASSLLQELSV
jgi:hypothetical protein